MIRILIFIACLVWVLANEEFPFKCRIVERAPSDKFAVYKYDCVPASEEVNGEKEERGYLTAQGSTGPEGPKGGPSDVEWPGPKGNVELPRVAGIYGSEEGPGEGGEQGIDGVPGSAEQTEHLDRFRRSNAAQISERSGDLAEIREEFETYKAEAEAAKRQSAENIDRLTEELVQSKIEIRSCTREKEVLQDSLATANVTIEACKRDKWENIDRLTEELVQSKIEIASCASGKEENSKLDAIVIKMTAKERQLRDRVARQKQKIFALRDDITNANATIEACRQDASALRDSITIANATIEACRQDNSEPSRVPENRVGQLSDQLQEADEQLDCGCDVLYDDKCYWVAVQDTKIDYDDAKTLCGCGAPADIISQRHYDKLSAHVRLSVFRRKQNAIDLWLGMTYNPVTREIKNSDGTRAYFVSWWLYGGYPLRSAPRTQLVLNVNRDANVQGMWNCMPGYYGLWGVICQK